MSPRSRLCGKDGRVRFRGLGLLLWPMSRSYGNWVADAVGGISCLVLGYPVVAEREERGPGFGWRTLWRPLFAKTTAIYPTSLTSLKGRGCTAELTQYPQPSAPK